jgi:hypothetical protein
LADWLAEFDLVLNYWPDPEGELSGRFPRRAGQVFLAATALPTCAPAAKHYCAPLRELGMETRGYFHRLDVKGDGRRDQRPDNAGNAPVSRAASQGMLDSTAPTNRPLVAGARPVGGGEPWLVAIHAGSGSATKNWPLERWATLCEWLKITHGAELLIVAGEADSTAADRLNRFGRSARNLPLLELTAQLANCRLFLGHDSGIGHLAAACGVPCLLLFGPTDPAVWAPPAPHVQAIKRGTTLESIAIADVQAAVSKVFSGQT